jgi:hypothetical protein
MKTEDKASKEGARAVAGRREPQARTEVSRELWGQTAALHLPMLLWAGVRYGSGRQDNLEELGSWGARGLFLPVCFTFSASAATPKNKAQLLSRNL